MAKLLWVVGLAAVCVCLGVPIQQLNLDATLQTQGLVALQKSDVSGKFANFMPLVKQAVVYSSVVLPCARANKDHKHPKDLTETVLVQTVADAAGRSDLEKYLPTADDMLDAMIAIGNVVGGSSGFNPIAMMTNIVGKSDMLKAMDEVMKFPFRFPDPTEEEMQSAQNVVLTIGLGFGSQEDALNKFIDSLSPEKKAMIDSLNKNVIEKLSNAMSTPDGEPTPALIEEVKRQMKEMEQKTGSTQMMPEDLKEMVRAADAKAAEHKETPNTQALVSVESSMEEQAKTQALIAIKADSTTGPFTHLLPLVGQVVIYTGAVLPSVRAFKEHKRNSELSASMLVQTVSDAAGDRFGDVEKFMPTPESMLDAVKKIGKVMGGSSGFNPMTLMTDVVGDEEMKVVIKKIMDFPFKFPDLTEEQLSTAEQVALAAGLGFETQEQAVSQFVASLNETQRSMIMDLKTSVFENMMGAIVKPDGQPTERFVEEIKKQMHDMEQIKGSTEMMPQELKDMVKDADAAAAHH
jgi:alkylhydroperoxidase/carboxymuconolactone decarboxylase family protein YurZ